MKIFTHVNVDFDAASSAALMKLHYSELYNPIIIESVFVSGSIEKTELAKLANGETYIAVDITSGIKGVRSAFADLLQTMSDEYQEAFDDLAGFADLVDCTPQAINKDNSLLTVFRALKYSTNSDQEMVKVWGLIIKGILYDYRDYKKALIEAESAQWYNNHKIAVIHKPVSHKTLGILAGKGAHAVIYKNGNNIGVRRYKTYETLYVTTKLQYALPDWFHHKNHFLSCWGSSKAPKTTSCNVSVKDLILILSNL